MAILYNEVFTVTFKISKVLFHNKDGFTIFAAKVSSYEDLKGSGPNRITGKGYFLDVSEDDTYRCKAKFIDDKKYGLQLEMEGVPLFVIPTSSDKLAKYISSHIKGVSLKKVKEIIGIMGVDIISVINKNPDSLNKVNLSAKQRDSLINFCYENNALEELITEFLSLGLPVKKAVQLYKRHGVNSLYAIENNPYMLYRYGCLSFSDLDKIVAGKNIMKPSDPQRLKTAVLAFLDERSIRYGDVCLSKRGVIQELQNFINRNNGFNTTYVFSEDEIENILNQMIKDLDLHSVNLKNGTEVYYSYDRYKEEETSAKYIAKNHNVPTYLCQFMDDITDKIKKNTWLGAKQKEAVLNCLTHKLSILTGGPGTGKTYSINAIIKIIESYPCNKDGDAPIITLCAPTGKAAQRMTELTGREALTLHSALKLIPENNDDIFFVPDPNFRLITDWLIVDEVSMVDSKLFAEIVKKTSKNAAIILCGDKDQLPSVGCGAVLEQLLNGGMVASVELDRVYRQNQGDTSIIDMSYLIRDKQSKDIRQFSKDGEGFSFLEYNKEDIIADHVRELYHKYTEEYGREKVMMLTPVHKDMCGTEMLNKQIQADIFEHTGKEKKYGFYIGDRVMQIANNKEKDVFNGDLGYVKEILSAKEYSRRFQEKKKKNKHGIEIDASSPAVCVCFDKGGRDRWVWKEELELAYAMTVHKAQGSEAEIVIMPFCNSISHQFMQRSKLIYTALTRAKGKFIGVGIWDRFCEGGCKEETHRRQSLLSYLSHRFISGCE